VTLTLTLAGLSDRSGRRVLAGVMGSPPWVAGQG
jgi:hypothetical protein